MTVRAQNTPPYEVCLVVENDDGELVEARTYNKPDPYQPTYIEAVVGRRWGIKVKNNTSGRIEIVASVDGKDVQTGKPATRKQGGLVITGLREVVLEGWRISQEEVATFQFSDEAESYAAVSDGDTTNLGVVGVVIYPEYVVSSTIRTLGGSNTRARGSNPDMSSMGATMTKGASIGTAFGESRSSRVGTTTFDRNESKNQEWKFRYESRENLEELGLIPGGGLAQRESANAFPAEKTNPNFCKIPEGWRGQKGFTMVELIIVVAILGIFLAVLGGGLSKCATSSRNPGGTYTDVLVTNTAIQYSTGEDGDRYYRVWTKSSGVFDFRDGFILGVHNAGEMWGQVKEGMVCTFETKNGLFICGKYKCVTRVVGCRWPKPEKSAKPKNKKDTVNYPQYNPR